MLAVGSHGRYPYHEGRHLVVALREFVYCDESGIHAGAPFCLVAGYRASPLQWSRFEKDWQAVLDKPAYKKVKVFHSKVFFNRSIILNPDDNPYLGWSDDKAHTFLGELLAVIRKRKIRPVGAAVNVPDFESLSFRDRCTLVGYEPKGRSQPHPYHLAFRAMAEDALTGAAPGTELHFVLGRQKELQQRALEGYNLLKSLGLEGLAPQMKGIGFEDPADFAGIQAADLFVHQWYGVLSRDGHISDQSRFAMNQLTHNRNDLHNIDAKGIEKIFANVGIDIEPRS